MLDNEEKKDLDKNCESQDISDDQKETNDLETSDENNQENQLDYNKSDKKEVPDPIEELKKENARLISENQILKLDLKQLSENYKKQVLEKAKQAENILNDKIEEVKEKYKNEFNEKQKYALQKDAEKLIEVINNFEFALKNSPNDPILKNYIGGFKMILGMFHNLLNDLGIREIKIVSGDMFDHEYMEVVEQIPSDRYKTNQVIEVLRPAYKLHDRVISFAKVRVAK